GFNPPIKSICYGYMVGQDPPYKLLPPQAGEVNSLTNHILDGLNIVGWGFNPPIKSICYGYMVGQDPPYKLLPPQVGKSQKYLPPLHCKKKKKKKQWVTQN
ncbi:hypothetical protein Q7292_08690, partial [Glaesserella parasuis]|nr:hypothetical protein [Glaesserella parasuis]